MHWNTRTLLIHPGLTAQSTSSAKPTKCVLAGLAGPWVMPLRQPSVFDRSEQLHEPTFLLKNKYFAMTACCKGKMQQRSGMRMQPNSNAILKLLCDLHQLATWCYFVMKDTTDLGTRIQPFFGWSTTISQNEINSSSKQYNLKRKNCDERQMMDRNIRRNNWHRQDQLPRNYLCSYQN